MCYSRCSVCVSECVRLLSIISLCFRMCQITLDVQFVFQNVSDHSMFSLCFRMCQIALYVQFVFLNVSGHS